MKHLNKCRFCDSYFDGPYLRLQQELEFGF